MKRQIRRGVFETNSSSTHSLTMCSRDTYSKWERGEVYRHSWRENFKTREEIIEELKTKKIWNSEELKYPDVDWDNTDEVNDIIRDNEWETEEEFWDNSELETFSESYTTEGGEEIIAFGYYGYDG
jgi:hypothetical protein